MALSIENIWHGFPYLSATVSMSPVYKAAQLGIADAAGETVALVCCGIGELLFWENAGTGRSRVLSNKNSVPSNTARLMNDRFI
jgi:hypothetical protein